MSTEEKMIATAHNAITTAQAVLETTLEQLKELGREGPHDGETAASLKYVLTRVQGRAQVGIHEINEIQRRWNNREGAPMSRAQTLPKKLETLNPRQANALLKGAYITAKLDHSGINATAKRHLPNTLKGVVQEVQSYKKGWAAVVNEFVVYPEEILSVAKNAETVWEKST